MDPLDTLAAAVTLARELPRLADERPGQLRALPYATDADSAYYRFLYEWCRRSRPAVTLEIGTYLGGSAAHMAVGNPDGHVWTLDINPDAVRHADALELPNLTALLGDSGPSVDRVRDLLPGPVDLLYIDGWHSFDQTFAEYQLYRPLVRPGGLMLFDDIDLQTATDEMQRFWTAVSEPKAKLDGLHHTGFGAIVCAEQRSPLLL